jgi:hypothetical protein
MGLLDGAMSGAAAESSSAAGPTQAPSSDGGPQCDGCPQPVNGDDQFCRHCGYSRKKCTACGKKLPTGNGSSSAGEFCPSCGAARSGQQVIRTSPVSGRAKGIGSFAKYLVAPLAVLVIAALTLAQPTIPRPIAQNFFTSYFARVTNGQQRGQLYAHELTTSFNQFTTLGQYNGFWNTVKSVSVDGQVYSVQGTSSEFTVSLTISYQTGATGHVRANYWLVCTGFRGNLLGRIPGVGCPGWALKIDNSQIASLPNGNG